MFRILGCSLLTFATSLSALGGTIYVDVDATGTGDGSSWTNAAMSVPDAMAGAQSGDEVWVARGTYYGTATLKDDVALIGGFDGTETTSAQSNPLANPTYLSGGGARRMILSTDNSATAVVRGFYLVRGSVPFAYNYGAAMKLENSNATIIDCVFTRNQASSLGGVAVIFGGSPTFVNCRFIRNDGMWAAGAIYNRNWGTPSFVNCLFAENTAWEGGAIASGSGAPTFTNCTFFGNSATLGKGGAIFDGSGESIFNNCIIWNNTAHVVGTEAFYSSPVFATIPTVSFSVIQDHDPDDDNIYPGIGNIDDDPRFVYPAGDNYQLLASSPARDAGRTGALPIDTFDVDLDGDTAEHMPDSLGVARLVGLAPDMGAFEYDGRTFFADFMQKNRYISIVPDNPGSAVAIRVTLVKSTLFPASNGMQWWVGAYMDHVDGGETYSVSRLGCTPMFADFSGAGVLHIGDPRIVPDAVYKVESVPLGGSLCDADGDFSPSAVVRTVETWGDIVGFRFDPTEPWSVADRWVTQADADASYARWVHEPDAPSMVRTDLAPAVPDVSAQITDRIVGLDAAAGHPYPYSAPTVCLQSGCVFGKCCMRTGGCANTLASQCSGTWTSSVMCEAKPMPCGSGGGGGKMSRN